MKQVERSTRAELKDLKVDLLRSAMGRAAVDMAQRLDDQPGDATAAVLSRELRLLMTALRGPEGAGGVSDVERFLAGIAATDSGNPTGSG